MFKTVIKCFIKKGLGTINKEKTREIERFARIENFSQAIKDCNKMFHTE